MKREKNHATKFPFVISSYNTVVPGHRINSFPDSFKKKKLGTTHFFNKIWGEIGKELGGKNIKKNELK